ncbi:MAG: hypothetical protein Q8P89_01295 [bacterium]|nr:hypothetical protein [bacterium]
MRKRVVSFLSIFAFSFILATQTMAQGATDSSNLENKIEDLKERVATRVAELRSQSQGFKITVGEIKSADENTIVLKTSLGEKSVLLTEESKIFRIIRGQRTTVAVSGLKIGERASVIGATEPQGDFVAKLVLIKTLPLNISGVIRNTDQKNFTISVENSIKGVTYLIDIESATKIQTATSGGKFEKSGFTKLQAGGRVHINGTKVEGEENRISAARILALPELSIQATQAPSPAEASPSPKTNPSPKVTPTVSPRVSPTRTPTP